MLVYEEIRSVDTPSTSVLNAAWDSRVRVNLIKRDFFENNADRYNYLCRGLSEPC